MRCTLVQLRDQATTAVDLTDQLVGYETLATQDLELLMDWYTPAEFQSPFALDFDPRVNVYEVVSRNAEGALQLTSANGQILTVDADSVADGLVVEAGNRVTGTRQSANGSLGEGSLHVEPLRPNKQEFDYAEAWFASLTAAGLTIEGVDLRERLSARLQNAPFGLRTMPPLRRFLRDLLEELVGRYPQRDDSWGLDDAPAMAQELLEEVGVTGFTPPAPKRIQHHWEALEPIVAECNATLQASSHPLRLVACEREIFPESLHGEGRDYLAEFPVWLLMTPSVALSLEDVGVLRRYRGAQFPVTAVDRDQRVLRPRACVEPKDAVVIGIDGAPPAVTASTITSPSVQAPTNPGPPSTPCRAMVRNWVPMDGTGELVTEDGVSVRFGASACKDLQPEIGMELWLISFKSKSRGYRATVVNLTGKIEKTRSEDAKEKRLQGALRGQQEDALLARSKLGEEEEEHWSELQAFSRIKLDRVAAELVELKRESHLFEELFAKLVVVSPESFHGHLDSLDWRQEPESLAWTNAPFEEVTFAAEMLDKSSALQLRERVPVGTIGTAHEIARRQRASANDLAAAILVLARCGAPEATAELEAWVKESSSPLDEVNHLLVVAGWQIHKGRMLRLWGTRPAFRIKRQPEGRMRRLWKSRPTLRPKKDSGCSPQLFQPSTSQCPACGAQLLVLLNDPSEMTVPFPLITCANCAVLDIEPYYVELAANGDANPLILEELEDDYEPMIRRDALQPIPIEFVKAPMEISEWEEDFEVATRVGGRPSWVQGPQSAGACPKCAAPMEFMAQFADPPDDLWSGDTGKLYVFGCEPCRVTASFVQNL